MKHYILCQHGLLGSQADFRNLAEHFHSLAEKSVEVVILSASTGMTQTLDGVVEGGRRCMHEILNLLQTGAIQRNSQVSFLGHSLGGLYVRYALRQIQIDHPTLWDDFCVKRNLCIFLATPHLGIECSNWVIRKSVDFLFRHVSSTAEDLSLRSPILRNLADEVGIESLNEFKRVVLYGNFRGDNLVSLSSSLLVPPGAVPQTNTTSGTSITEFSPPSTTTNSSDVTDSRSFILHHLSSGLHNLSRFIVFFPPGLLGGLSVIDNTAHHRIICHGILDRGKAGLPILKHIEDLISDSNDN